MSVNMPSSPSPSSSSSSPTCLLTLKRRGAMEVERRNSARVSLLSNGRLENTSTVVTNSHPDLLCSSSSSSLQLSNPSSHGSATPLQNPGAFFSPSTLASPVLSSSSFSNVSAEASSRVASSSSFSSCSASSSLGVVGTSPSAAPMRHPPRSTQAPGGEGEEAERDQRQSSSSSRRPREERGGWVSDSSCVSSSSSWTASTSCYDYSSSRPSQSGDVRREGEGKAEERRSSRPHFYSQPSSSSSSSCSSPFFVSSLPRQESAGSSGSSFSSSLQASGEVRQISMFSSSCLGASSSARPPGQIQEKTHDTKDAVHSSLLSSSSSSSSSSRCPRYQSSCSSASVSSSPYSTSSPFSSSASVSSLSTAQSVHGSNHLPPSSSVPPTSYTPSSSSSSSSSSWSPSGLPSSSSVSCSQTSSISGLQAPSNGHLQVKSPFPSPSSSLFSSSSSSYQVYVHPPQAPSAHLVQPTRLHPALIPLSLFTPPPSLSPSSLPSSSLAAAPSSFNATHRPPSRVLPSHAGLSQPSPEEEEGLSNSGMRSDELSAARKERQRLRRLSSSSSGSSSSSTSLSPSVAVAPPLSCASVIPPPFHPHLALKRFSSLSSPPLRFSGVSTPHDTSSFSSSSASALSSVQPLPRAPSQPASGVCTPQPGTVVSSRLVPPFPPFTIGKGEGGPGDLLSSSSPTLTSPSGDSKSLLLAAAMSQLYGEKYGVGGGICGSVLPYERDYHAVFAALKQFEISCAERRRRIRESFIQDKKEVLSDTLRLFQPFKTVKTVRVIKKYVRRRRPVRTRRLQGGASSRPSWEEEKSEEEEANVKKIRTREGTRETGETEDEEATKKKSSVRANEDASGEASPNGVEGGECGDLSRTALRRRGPRPCEVDREEEAEDGGACSRRKGEEEQEKTAGSRDQHTLELKMTAGGEFSKEFRCQAKNGEERRRHRGGRDGEEGGGAPAAASSVDAEREEGEERKRGRGEGRTPEEEYEVIREERDVVQLFALKEVVAHLVPYHTFYIPNVKHLLPPEPSEAEVLAEKKERWRRLLSIQKRVRGIRDWIRDPLTTACLSSSSSPSSSSLSAEEGVVERDSTSSLVLPSSDLSAEKETGERGRTGRTDNLSRGQGEDRGGFAGGQGCKASSPSAIIKQEEEREKEEDRQLDTKEREEEEEGASSSSRVEGSRRAEVLMDYLSLRSLVDALAISIRALKTSSSSSSSSASIGGGGGGVGLTNASLHALQQHHHHHPGLSSAGFPGLSSSSSSSSSSFQRAPDKGGGRGGGGGGGASSDVSSSASLVFPSSSSSLSSRHLSRGRLGASSGTHQQHQGEEESQELFRPQPGQPYPHSNKKKSWATPPLSGVCPENKRGSSSSSSSCSSHPSEPTPHQAGGYARGKRGRVGDFHPHQAGLPSSASSSSSSFGYAYQSSQGTSLFPSSSSASSPPPPTTTVGGGLLVDPSGGWTRSSRSLGEDDASSSENSSEIFLLQQTHDEEGLLRHPPTGGEGEPNGRGPRGRAGAVEKGRGGRRLLHSYGGEGGGEDKEEEDLLHLLRCSQRRGRGGGVVGNRLSSSCSSSSLSSGVSAAGGGVFARKKGGGRGKGFGKTGGEDGENVVNDEEESRSSRSRRGSVLSNTSNTSGAQSSQRHPSGCKGGGGWHESYPRNDQSSQRAGEDHKAKMSAPVYTSPSPGLAFPGQIAPPGSYYPPPPTLQHPTTTRTASSSPPLLQNPQQQQQQHGGGSGTPQGGGGGGGRIRLNLGLGLLQQQPQQHTQQQGPFFSQAVNRNMPAKNPSLAALPAASYPSPQSFHSSQCVSSVPPATLSSHSLTASYQSQHLGLSHGSENGGASLLSPSPGAPVGRIRLKNATTGGRGDG